MTMNQTASDGPTTASRKESIMNRELYIPCRIDRGGFSTERVFTIEFPEGAKTFAGYFEHFLDQDKQKLSLAEPPEGQTIEGFAKCRVLQRNEDGTLIIDIPSSDTVLTQYENLVEAG